MKDEGGYGRIVGRVIEKIVTIYTHENDVMRTIILYVN